MSRIDFDARARALLSRLERSRLHDDQGRMIADALRAVALAAGDLVERAHCEHGEDESAHACPECDCGYVVVGDDDIESCTDCGGTGVADAAIVLGLTRPR